MRVKQRKPEAGVDGAVDQLRSQLDQRRVLVFSLRSVVQFTSSNNRHYVDNVYSGVQNGLVSVLVELLGKYVSDEDIVHHLAKILSGVTKAFDQDPDEEGIQQAIDQGYATLLAGVVDASIIVSQPSDGSVWPALDSIVRIALQNNVLTVEDTTLEHIDTKLNAPKFTRPYLAVVCGLLNLYTRQHPKSTKIVDLKIPTKLLNNLYKNSRQGNNAFDSESLQFLSESLGTVLAILPPTGGYPDHEDATGVVLKLLELVRGKKALTETLSRILAALVGPEQLKKSAEAIGKGGKESLQALELLSALSHSSAFTASFQDAGPLCNILNQCDDVLDEAKASSVKAACSMLTGLLTNNPKEVGKANVQEASGKVREFLKSVEGMSDDLSEAVYGLASALSSSDAAFGRSVNSGTVEIIAKTVTPSQNPDTAMAALKLLSHLPTVPADLEAVEVAFSSPDKRLMVPAAKICETFMRERKEESLIKVLPAIVNGLKSLTADNRAEMEALLPMLQMLSAASEVGGPLAKVESDLSVAVLRCSMTFADIPHIVKACETYLRKTASTADIQKAIDQLVKLSKEPKKHFRECVDACATVHGVSSLSGTDGVGAESLDGLIKALGHVCQCPYFPEQRQLITHVLTCVKSLAPIVSNKEPLKEEPHRLLAIAHSAGCRAIADQEQNSTGDSVVTDIVRCATVVTQLDHFEALGSLEKCMGDISTLMRKYPEQRKTQVACLQFLSVILALNSGDVSPEFLKSGASKQVLGTMSRGSAIEEYQAVGLRVVLTCAKKRPENVDGLRRAGVTEVLKMVSENYQSKADVLKLCQQCQAILMPQDQARDEVLSQIEALQIAGRNRDVKTGGEALATLAGLSAAADAAKFAAKNGVGNAVNAFFESMKVAPAVPFQNLETCSLGAVQTLRNVGNVGKPHSSMLLKGGAIPLIQTILEEALQQDNAVASEVVAQCLEAGRCLLTNESNPAAAPGAQEFSARLTELLPQLAADPKQVMGIVSTVGLLASEETLNGAAFNASLPRLIEVLEHSTSETERVDALRCIFQMVGRDRHQNKLVQKFAEAGGCEAVIRCLDSYGQDENKTAIWCRKVLERIVSANGDGTALRQAMLKRGGSNALDFAVRALGRNLGGCRDDADSTATVLGMLCKLTTKVDKKRLQDMDLLGTVTEALVVDGSTTEMKGLMGELLGNLGGDALVDDYFQEVIDLCDRKPDRWKSELASVLQKLETFVFCHPDDVDAAFGKAPQAVSALARILPGLGNDVELLEHAALTVKNLAHRFADDPMSNYGVQTCIQSGFAHTAIGMINDSGKSSCVRKSSNFLRDMYETLELCCSSEVTYSAVAKLATANSDEFLKSTWDLLYRYKNQEDVATAIISFIGHFSRNTEAVEALERARKTCDDYDKVRELGGDVSEAVWNIVWNLRRNGQSVGNGLDALGMIAANASGRLTKVLNGSSRGANIDKIKQLAETGPEAAAGFAGFCRCLMTAEVPGTEDIWMNLLEILVKQYYSIRDDESTEQDVRDRLLRRMGGCIEAFAQRKQFNLVRGPRGIECLTEAVKAESHNQQAARSLVASCFAMREDSQSWNTLCSTALPVVVVEGFETVTLEQDVADQFLDLSLELAQVDEDNLRIMQETSEIILATDSIKMNALSNGYPATGELCVKCDKLRGLLAAKLEQKLKLETVYKRWVARIDRNGGSPEILELGTNAGKDLLAEFEFVYRETEELSRNLKLQAVAQDPVAREFWFGCHCFTLLHQLPLNARLLCEARGTTHVWAVQALKKQPLEESLQTVVEAVVDAVNNAPEDYAGVEGMAAIAVEVVRRCTEKAKCQEGVTSWTVARVPTDHGPFVSDPGVAEELSRSVESWMVERLVFMARLCSQRTFYNDTEALNALKYVWTLVDRQEFGVSTLKSLMRVLRAMANEGICEEFIELKYPEALLELVDGLSTPKDLLADVLMVIGFMASFTKTKNYFGRLEGVRRIVALLKRSEKEKPSASLSRVQQNACLAIGNLVLGHPQNGTLFGKEGGVDLTNRILNRAMDSKVDYDLANAACVLMCNASFKRDDFKEAFGRANSPSFILQCFRTYDGADVPAAHRCLGSMFKAVGNLALVPSNVQRFLDGDIGGCMKIFYRRADSVPDELLLVSLKTLSNLTLENADAFMNHFGAILVPLIDIISSGKHNHAGLMAFMCDTFASLCRNVDNRKVFLSHQGVEQSISLVNEFKDEQLYIKALDLFAVLGSYSDAAQRMADNGLFSFILGVLEEGDDLDALTVVAALRVIRRLVADKAVSDMFIRASPMALLTECIKAAAPFAEDSVPSALTVKEVCHILLTLIYLHASEYGSDVDYQNAVNPREVAWAQELLSGVAIRSQQFSRVFSRRVPASDVSEEGSDDSEDTRGSSAADMVSASSEASAEIGNDEEGSPVDLHTPPRRDESNSQTDSNVNKRDILVKPKGPRSYSEIGLDAKALTLISRALFVMFLGQHDDVLHVDKLSEFGLSLLAYTACEKPDGCGLVFTDCNADVGLPLLVSKIFGHTKTQKGEGKIRLLAVGADLVGNACCIIPANEIAAISNSTDAMGALRSAASALTKKREAPLRKRIDDIWSLLEGNKDAPRPEAFYSLATYEFPIDGLQLSREEFPNGVQDLPGKIRNKIRKGGKSKCLIKNEAGQYTLKPLWWKSSGDMSELRFMTDASSQNYDFHIPLSRVRKIVRGTQDPDLTEQIKQLKGNHDHTNHNTLVLHSLAHTCQLRQLDHSIVSAIVPSVKTRHIVSVCGGDAPEVNMVFSNRIKTSRMYERIATWHAAATR
ncbi:hypothetical protein GNI_005330 [Gregarina niphandrodes]|uniref:Uncharacterized protein n=1 Tax=Gregarina niphandrodes TaxID=110365 RepID=A0A023BDC6_GRENI|nr:hypothetical protein GNI_005330 [Gregarina niphandrodes]EZG88185.1 hypothetical protein GNI_005330 [Gregarina niphandrodes]|eukprot:XP_011128609.1 hypothetical protein GNI_005330 [Gregarina niphandrodes]